jgi:hypothetical protein
MHGGGKVGGVGGAFRSIDPAMFLGAPRFHNGLFATNEFPAILEAGETVIPKGANYAAVPNVTINMENNSSKDLKMETTDTGFDSDEYIINTIIKDAAANGPMRNFGRTIGTSAQGG